MDAIGVPTVSLDYFRAAEADDEGHTEHLGKDIAVPIMYVNFIKATFVVPAGHASVRVLSSGSSISSSTS